MPEIPSRGPQPSSIARWRRCALALLLACGALPGAAQHELANGLIPLQLAEEPHSYLGVHIEIPEVWECGQALHGSHDARLLIVNDGGSHRPWEGTIPLRLLGTSVEGDSRRAEVRAEAFDLAGPSPWQGPCGDFRYFLRLDRGGPQPISSLTLVEGRDGSSSMFAGTLYVKALLFMSPVETGETFVQALSLALNPAGYWVAIEPSELPDEALSNVILFADREGEVLKDRSTCVPETHPLGHYCLQLSPELLAALGGH